MKESNLKKEFEFNFVEDPCIVCGSPYLKALTHTNQWSEIIWHTMELVAAKPIKTLSLQHAKYIIYVVACDKQPRASSLLSIHISFSSKDTVFKLRHIIKDKKRKRKVDS